MTTLSERERLPCGHLRSLYSDATDRCGTCYDSNRYQNNPAVKERIKERSRASYHRNKGTGPVRRYTLLRYKLTSDDFTRLLAAQGNVCAICRQPDPGTGKRTWWVVDHDHSCCPGRQTCGKCVRGLLCVKCNSMLPLIENSDQHQRALEYLEKWTRY